MEAKFTREGLMEALEAKRPVFVAFDGEQLRKHRERNKEIAKARREYLRGLIKLSDDKLAEYSPSARWSLRSSNLLEMPYSSECPISHTVRLDRALEWLKNDSRKTMTISDNDQYGTLLAFDPGAADGTVC